jgi:16S rRNA (cytosine1402-N4)-methyltransferase
MTNHVSVLRDEVVQAFEGLEINTFFDGTLGAGGHAEAILEAHPEIKRYIGCDRDPRAHELAVERLKTWSASSTRGKLMALMVISLTSACLPCS